MFAISIQLPDTGVTAVVAEMESKEQVSLWMRETMAVTVACANYQNQEAQFIPVNEPLAVDGVAYNLLIDGRLMSTLKCVMIDRPLNATLH